MKFLFVAALATLAVPALAQTPAAPAPVAAPTNVAKFNLDTPIETLAADDKAKAVLTADLPLLLPHPSYESFKAMSLRALQPYSGGVITDDLLKKVETDLAAIK